MRLFSVALLVVSCGCARVDATRPLPIPLQTHRTVHNRVDLANPLLWVNSTALLIVEGRRPGEFKTLSVPAKSIYYDSDTVGEWLSVITDPRTKTTYIVPYGQSFYVSGDSDMWSCILGNALAVRGSMLQMPTRSFAAVVDRLAKDVSDTDLLAWRERGKRIDLTPGVPSGFWTARGGLDSQAASPKIAAIDYAGGTLRLDLVSGGGDEGVFWIDFENRKLLRTIVNGTEAFPVNRSPVSRVPMETVLPLAPEK